MEFKVLTTQDKNLWHEYLNRIPDELKDIYYLPEYLETWKEHEQAEIYCAVAEQNQAIVLYPFFKKEIKEFELAGGPWFDLSSAYGYGGAIIYDPAGEGQIKNDFNHEFDQWCIRENIVAEFIRENPILNNQLRLAEYVPVRNNVYIELGQDYEIANRHVKKNLRKAARNGLSYKWDPELKYIEDYKKLYNASFNRLEMDSYYLFPDSYYNKVSEIFAKHSGLVNIYLDNKIINSMLVFYGFDKFICHLIGTDYNYFEFRPNDLVYKASIDIAKEMNMKYISMGGGIVKDDNLFRFKEKFGNLVRDVYIGKKIIHQDIYSELCSAWENKYPQLAESKKSFFLKYRIKA